MGSSLQVFPMEVYFVGKNCDQEADKFFLSLYERYTPDKPGTLQHPRWGDVPVIPFGTPEQSESYVSGAGISRVSVTFRETRSKKAAKSAALSSDQNNKNLAKAAESALERAQKGIATGKAAYSKFKSQIRNKVKSITDAIDTVADLITDIEDEVTEITQDIYAAIDEAALPVTILSQIGNILTTVASVPSQSGAMATAYVELAKELMSRYSSDLAAAVTKEDKLNISDSLQYVGSVATGCIAIAALASSYETRDEVGSVIDALVDSYTEYLALLDAASASLSSEGIAEAFVPDHDTGSYLQAVVLDTQALLIDRAFSLKVARSYTLTAPSDPMTDTWVRYGDLSRLDFYCKTNGIGGGEFIELPPGRKLVYYA
jgi:prophage DNA circulation protein